MEGLVFADVTGDGVGRALPREKRAFDVVLAVLLLLMCIPVILVIAILVRLDSAGPVIYKQERVGFNRRRRHRRLDRISVKENLRQSDRRHINGEGRHFFIYKFRTMRADAESGGPQWAEENDPRVTRIGRVLRLSHLDELLQLWNVVLGDMSLVGPRPERPYFVQRFATGIPRYRQRLLAPPGITGLAQVEHCYDSSEADVRRKLDYDLRYIRQYSLAHDLRILFKTILVMLTRKGSR